MSGKWLAQVRHDHRVHSSGFRLAHALVEKAGRSTVVTATRRRMQAVSGLSREAFDAALGRLADRGYIAVTGSPSEFTVTILFPDSRNRPFTASGEHGEVPV